MSPTTTISRSKEYFESYSNLAYNIAGLVALWLHGDVLVCLGFQALGIGSFIYHYHKTKPIYLFDWWAMAFLNTIVAGYHFDSMLAWSCLVGFHVIYSYLLMGKLHVFIEVGISTTIGLTAIYFNRSLPTFITIVVIFLIALWIRSKDKDPKQAIFHDSAFHSIWHILTAIGYYLAFYLSV
jgi:hypothetical protein